MSVNELASGKIHWSRDLDISRANAPLEFWFVFFSTAAITVFGTRLAVRYREAIWGDWESYRSKTFQYLGLFCFLAIIYSIYLAAQLTGVTPSPVQSDALPALAKLCLISALPFAVLAYSDQTWRSEDAAPVCAGAWIVVCAALSTKCEICAFALACLFFPFVLSALSAHAVGTFFRFLRQGGMKSIYGG